MRISITAQDVTPDRAVRIYPPRAPVVVTRATAGEHGRYRLLAGPAPAQTPTTAWCLAAPEAVAALDAIGSSSQPLDRPSKLRLACVLAPYLRAPQLAALLDHRDSAEVWRWGALERAAPKLRDAVHAGQLTMRHARPLLALPHAAQTDWATRALRGRWSARRLTTALRQDNGVPADTPSSADVQALETTVGNRLGATVRVHWPEDPAAQRRLVIDWFDVESLKGILAQLAAGPELPDEPLQTHPRQLVIPVQNASELSALTQHLLGD